MDRRQTLRCLAASVLAPYASAQAASPGCPRLKRGVNLHHLLNWPDIEDGGGAVRYVWPPFQDAGHTINRRELDRLVAYGFDFVRITADPSIFILTEPPRRAALMDHAQHVVRQILQAGLNVVFDLHPVEVNPAYGPERLVQAQSSDQFRGYCDMVERVAAMLNGFPSDRVAFELMNEPWIVELSEAPRWQPMLEDLHARARRAAPTLPLVLTGILWSDFKALLRVDISPFRASNVIYTFHYYDPHTFTHQGVEGDDARFIAGLPWPANGADGAAAVSSATARIQTDVSVTPSDKAAQVARTRELVDAVSSGAYDGRRIARDFDEVARWADRHDVPRERILLGEFGCVRSSHGIATGPGRVAWLSAIRQAAEARNFGWAYWVYKGYGGMELVRADGSGVVDPETAAALGLKPLDGLARAP